jgi:DNA-binding XRE family transcriptional regulator
MNDKQRKTIEFTAEQRAQHRAIREAFREWHPGPEELIASGAAAQLGLNVIHFPAQELLRRLKASRESAGLTLADVSARCGIDQPALSRLENGHSPNPTVDTLWRYAAALGKRLVMSTEDIKNRRPVPSNAGRTGRRKVAMGRKKTA